MESSDRIWIDAGYVSGVSSHQCIEVDVSKFIEFQKSDLVKPNTSCGIFELNEGKKMFSNKRFCWYSCLDMIIIEEYLFQSKTIFKCGLRLYGVSCFHQEIFMGSSGPFFYIIFGVALSLGIFTFRLDKVSPSIPLFSTLTETETIKHRLKFYNIDSYHFTGLFLEFSEAKFSFCTHNVFKTFILRDCVHFSKFKFLSNSKRKNH
ncbi:hypothetical protein MXB_4324 [Myxobolus squamalis]|nr:hypothetical protein MXB_4324 [Myxobolus squamalis]